VEEIEEKVKRTIEKYSLIKRGEKILIGVSGGIDSMTLLYILNELKEAFSITLGVATFNHKIRSESEKEVELVKNYADALGLPFFKGEGDAIAFSKETRKSLEDAARELRFNFLFSIAKEVGFDKIALAHNLNDFVETFFIHLLKGSGARGLTSLLGMERNVIHPLIEITRREIVGFANEKGIPYATDYLNFDLSYERNKLRHQILPLLSSISEHFEEHILRLSDVIFYEDAYLERIAEIEFKTISRQDNGFSLVLFNELPLPIKRRLLRKILGEAYNYKSVEDAIEFLIGTERKKNIREDIYLVKSGGVFYIEKEAPFSLDTEYILNIPGETLIKEAGISIITEIIDKGVNFDFQKKNTVYFDFEKIHFPLKVRFRKPGDRVTLEVGRKKLQDIFVDLHIRKDKRYKVPLIVDNEGEILWIVPYKRNSLFKIDENTKKVLIFNAITQN